MPTCPVFTRAKIKSRFGIIVNLPSQYVYILSSTDRLFRCIALISVARHVRCLTLESELGQLYVSLITSSKPPTISTEARKFNVYVFNFFICLHFMLTETGSSQFIRRALHNSSGITFIPSLVYSTPGGHIYCQTLFRWITTYQCDQTREMPRARIETRLTFAIFIIKKVPYRWLNMYRFV